MNRWFDGSMDRWFDGSMNRWFAGAMDRWFDGSLVRWIAGSILVIFGRLTEGNLNPLTTSSEDEAWISR